MDYNKLQKIIEVGLRIESNLNSGMMSEGIFTGIINNIVKENDEDDIIVDIKRDDGQAGDGFNHAWRTVMRKDNCDRVTIFSGDWDL